MSRFLVFFRGREIIDEGPFDKFTLGNNSSARLRDADVVVVRESHRGAQRTTAHTIKKTRKTK